MLPLILASSSPRRLELLRQIGIEPVVCPSDADETTSFSQPWEMVMELAEKKARSSASCYASREDAETDVFLLGADTLVVSRGQILGKPRAEEQAREMLRSLQGNTHEVYTGVSILYGECKDGAFREKNSRLFYSCTEVSCAEMDDAEIDAYIRSGEPMDKAGAYGIQGLFAKHIRGINGDYGNVVGLPLHAVYAALKEMRSQEGICCS